MALRSGLFETLIEYAITGGGPGLLSLAFADSAGLPTGGAPDIVLILLLSVDPRLLAAVTLVVAVSAGSVAGCLVLYHMGRKSGDLALQRIAG